MIELSMTPVIILVAAFLVLILLLLFPFLLHKKVHYSSEMETSLIVKSDNVKDARYFAKSFREKIKKSKLFDDDDRKQEHKEEITLSKDERILIYDGTVPLDSCVDYLCYINVETEFSDKITFSKEIYAEENIVFAAESRVRAIAGEKQVIIGEHSVIDRWADAEKFMVLKEGSDAGINLSSGRRMIVEAGCKFTRLYAPVVEFRKYSGETDEGNEEVAINRAAPVYMKIVRNLEKVGMNQEERHTIITKYDLNIEPGAIVYGDVKSDKMIHIKEKAVVTGNVFADNNIIIEAGAKILGNVFAGNNLYIGPGATVGKAGRIKSALSRNNMIITENAVIYGYAGCEQKGKTVTYDEFYKETGISGNENISNIKDRTREFGYEKCSITGDGFLDMDVIKNYEDIDYYAFRKCMTLTKVKLPEGINKIGESMFYGCENLETVILPDSLEEIGNYAFCGCTRLKNVVKGENSRLKKIGDYAFAKCENLNNAELAQSDEIGYAAFWK